MTGGDDASRAMRVLGRDCVDDACPTGTKTRIVFRGGSIDSMIPFLVRAAVDDYDRSATIVRDCSIRSIQYAATAAIRCFRLCPLTTSPRA